jgi:hypothetical protein
LTGGEIAWTGKWGKTNLTDYAKEQKENSPCSKWEDQMTTIVDFYGAGRRHYEDAELLMNHTRLPNAGHLFGFAAECGVKALLVTHGLSTDPATGDLVETRPYKYKTHINVLISNVQAFQGSQGYSKYLGMMPNLRTFSNWDTSHRYYNESSIPASLTDWRTAAAEVIKMLDQAKLDGVIR